MKSILVDKETVGKIKYAYEKFKILLALYFEDQSYEEQAFKAFSEFNKLFDHESLSHGIVSGNLSFTTSVLVGEEMEPLDKVAVEDDFIEAYLKKEFYNTCLKSMPSNSENMIQELIDKFAHWTSIHDQMPLSVIYIDFEAKTAYVKR